MIPSAIQEKAKRYFKAAHQKEWHDFSVGEDAPLFTPAHVTLSPSFEARLSDHPVYRGDKTHAILDIQLLYAALFSAPKSHTAHKLRPWLEHFLAQPYPVDLNAAVKVNPFDLPREERPFRILALEHEDAVPFFLNSFEANALSLDDLPLPLALRYETAAPLFIRAIEKGTLSLNDPMLHHAMRDPEFDKPVPISNKLFDYLVHEPNFEMGSVNDTDLRAHVVRIVGARCQHRQPDAADRMAMLLGQGYAFPTGCFSANSAQRNIPEIYDHYLASIPAKQRFEEAAATRKAGQPDFNSPYDINNLTTETCLEFTPNDGIEPLIDPVLWHGHEDQFRALMMQFHPSVRGSCSERSKPVLAAMLESSPAQHWARRVQGSQAVRSRA